MTNNKKQIKEYRKEVKNIMGDQEALNTLAKYTFDGLKKENIPAALMEGMMKGFTPEDFFKQNVYAIPFWNNSKKRQEYSLVTSIDYARKIAARSGLSGKSAPKFKDDENGNPKSCSVTVWREGGDKRGYTATVYFEEYVKTDSKGNPTRIWKSKPRTMIAKVAEMHALRMAFPEELQNHYSEEEMEKEHTVLSEEDFEVEKVGVDEDLLDELDEIETIEDLKEFYSENKGKGKEVAKLIAEKKKEITSEKNNGK